MAKNELQGTLGLLMLKALAQTGPMHGYGILLHIARASKDVLTIEEGSLYPALHRIEQNGWVRSEWAPSENNRRAKYYSLTPLGRRQLSREEKQWAQLVAGVTALLEFA